MPSRYRQIASVSSPSPSPYSSSSSSVSLASFPTLSSVSFDDDDQESHSQWKPPIVHDLDSDASDRDNDAGYYEQEQQHYAVDSGGDSADDETPDLIHKSRRASSPRRRRRSTSTRSLRPRASPSPPSQPPPPPPPPPLHDAVVQVIDATDSLRRRHFTACFVRVDPPLLRSLVHLDLSSANLKRTELHSLTMHLFLLSALRWLSLADNQLDDTCTKDLRAVISVDGLEHVDLSRNLLGRGVARMLADRLKHRLTLRSLDVTGNRWFFAYEDAGQVACLLAQGVTANTTLIDFRISLPQRQPHLERDRFVLAPVDIETSPHKRSSGSSIDTAAVSCPAEAFTRELATAYSAATKPPSLYSIGLVHAELSRRAIVNLMKVANKLIVVLDLSFAFMGISSAQVIATALKMKDYATLTQLTLRGNRLKDMGARAILKALHVNARLTNLNLSRNELRSDLAMDIAAMLRTNKTLVTLDLTQNELLFACVEDTQTRTGWRGVEEAVASHLALLSFGDLGRLSCTAEQRESLARLLQVNRQRQDDLVLRAVQQSAANHSAIGLVHTTTLPMQDRTEGVVWRQRAAVSRQSLVTFSWKMRAFAVVKKHTRGSTSTSENGDVGEVVWRVFVRRQCDVNELVEVEAASGHMTIAASSASSSYVLNSVVVHCEEGDSVSIAASVDSEEDAATMWESIKLQTRDIVVLPQPMTGERVAFHIDTVDSTSRSIAWQPKRIRQPLRDKHTHTAMVMSTYLHQGGWYRVVWRVRCSLRLLDTATEPLRWIISRRHCWDQETEEVVVEGSSRAFHAVVRSGCDLLLSSEPVELMAGEMVTLHATTDVTNSTLELLHAFIIHSKD